MNLRALHLALFLLAAPAFLPPAHAQGEAETGTGSPFDAFTGKKDVRKPRPPDIYVKKIAARFDRREDDITRLWQRGYGRNELIKVLLIAAGSGKELREVVRERDRGTRLSALAAKYGLDYDEIMKESIEIRGELDKNVAGAARETEVPVSTGSFTPYPAAPPSEAAPQVSTAPAATEKDHE